MRRIPALVLGALSAAILAACGGGGGGGSTSAEAAGSSAGAGTTAAAGTAGGSGTASSGSSGSGGGVSGAAGGSTGSAGTAGGGGSGSAGTGSSGSGSGAGGAGASGGTAGSAGGGGSGSSGSGTTGTTTGSGGSGTTGTTGTGGTAATPLTLSASVPANNDGVIATSSALRATNEARAADSAVPTPYCALSFQIARSSNAKTYNVTVYFRQADAKALHASIVDGGGLWIVAATDVVNGIAGVDVDVVARTVRFDKRSLVGVPDPLQPFPVTVTESTVADGSVSFPANDSAVAACGI